MLYIETVVGLRGFWTGKRQSVIIIDSRDRSIPQSDVDELTLHLNAEIFYTPYLKQFHMLSSIYQKHIPN